MKVRDVSYRCIRVMSVLFVCSVILITFRDLILASAEVYPREYREAANLAVAKLFFEGINPYKINNGLPICVNVYGFINPLIAASLSKIFGIGLIRSFYILSFIYTVVIAILITYEIYSIVGITKRSSIFYPFVFFFAYTVTFSSGHILSRPDHLGVIISLIIMMILRRNICTRNVLISSGCAILLFYVKPYFLFYVFPVCLFLLIKNKKLFIIYMGSLIAIGLGTFFFIRWAFPLYYVETLYFEFIENFISNGNTSLGENGYELIIYSMKQFRELFCTYYVLFISLITIFLVLLIKRIPFFKNKLFECKFSTTIEIYLLNIVMAIPVLFVLGKNKGAWVSYHMQLLMPAVIIGGFVGIISFSGYRKYLEIVLLCFLAVSTPKVYNRYGRVEFLSNEEKNAWEKIENVCISSVEKGKQIYASCLVNGLIIDRVDDYYTYNTGHDYYYGVCMEPEGLFQFVDSNKLLSNMLFPTFVESVEYMNTLYRDDLEKLDKNVFDIIIGDNKTNIKPRNIEDYNSMNLELHSGAQNWETTVYIKKTSYEKSSLN